MDKRIKNAELDEWVYSGKSKIHGTGLFAAKNIKKNQYIGTYWGPIAKRNGMHVLWVYEDEDDESSAVGRNGKNLLRYLNHSRSGNCHFDGFDLYASKRIKAGDEMTFDYMESDFD